MLIEITLCLVIASVVWRLEILTFQGSTVALLISIFLLINNTLSWLLLLVSFMVLGYISTKWKIEYKDEKGLSESSSGIRDVRNVLGNGLSPLIFAFFFSPVAFIASISTAMADTFASEIGVLSDKAWLITTFERVKPGTNGAISVLGIFSALVGAIIVSILGYFLLGVTPIYTALGGFFGCQVDSVLGATLERRGFLNKSLVNFLAGLSGGLFAYILVSFI